MNLDDETTASQLYQLLIENRILISLKTILRCQTQLGWTFRGSVYYQLIRNVNKQKRLEWAHNNLAEAESGFLDVIWTDESSIQLDHEVGNAPKCKPRCVDQVYYVDHLMCEVH